MSIFEAIAYLKAEVPPNEPVESILVSDDDFPAHRHMGNGLTCFYLLDRGESFEYVKTGQLRENAESLDSLHSKAVANLASIAAEKLVVRSYQDIFVALMGGNFEASLLLIDDIWDETYSHVVENDFVAVLPARDILAFCDSESETGKAQLFDTVQRIWPDEDHLISDRIYRRIDRRWQVYQNN